MKKLIKKTVSLVLSLVLSVSVAQAQTAGEAGDTDKGDITCPDAKLLTGKMISDICWKCVMPIRVAGVSISGSTGKDHVPSGASKKQFCMCSDGTGLMRPGITTSFWEPSYVIEEERTPGCMSALAGLRLPFNKTNRGRTGHDNAQDHRNVDSGYRHYHFYAFPIMIMIDMFVPKMCNAGGYHDFDIMFMSEVDPTWNHDELSFFAHFENALVANPVATTACIADAVSSNIERPIDSLWWCAGSWGALYPLVGHIYGSDGTLLQSSKQSARAIAALHRRGFLYGTVGDDNLCGGNITPRIPKTQYRFTMFFPKPETDDSHVLGESPLIWGLNRLIPAVGEDPVYIVWRWLDCCNI